MFQVRILRALARFSRLGLAVAWVEVGAWEVDVAFGASPIKKSFGVKRRLTKLSEFPWSDGALVLQIFWSVYLMIKLLRTSRWEIDHPCLHRNFPKMTKSRVLELLIYGGTTLHVPCLHRKARGYMAIQVQVQVHRAAAHPRMHAGTVPFDGPQRERRAVVLLCYVTTPPSTTFYLYLHFDYLYLYELRFKTRRTSQASGKTCAPCIITTSFSHRYLRVPTVLLPRLRLWNERALLPFHAAVGVIVCLLIFI